MSWGELDMRIVLLNLMMAGTFLLHGCSQGDEGKSKQIEIQSPKETVEIESAPITDVYKIEVSATERGPTSVQFKTAVNLPLPIEVMAGLSLQGQKPNDTWIGYSEKVTLTKPEQSFILDFPHKPIPTGKYAAEVSFYPRWGAKNGNPKAAKIEQNIEGKMVIQLIGNGVDASDRIEKEKMQRWIIDNVYTGAAYDKGVLEQKLGSSIGIKVKTLNPNIIEGHYFPNADMTIYVNILKKEFVTFKFGRTEDGL